MKYMEEAWSLVSQRGIVRKYESTGYTSLMYPQGWLLGPLLLVLTVLHSG